mgnify:CR=1 FL=1
MRREELEHIIRAAGAVTNEDELIIIGSQAVLGQFPDTTGLLCQSMEADIIPIASPEKWNLIDGLLGEGSPFHETFGYYADGVEEQTAILPLGWKERLIPISNENTRGVVGRCLEIHDLLISKYCAGRPKDREFTSEAVQRNMVKQALLLERLKATELDAELKEIVRSRINGDFQRQ